MALQFEARKIALKQDRNGFILTLAIHPDELPEEMFRDFVGARYGCAMVRIEDDESAKSYNNRVQRAAMLCRDMSFQEWLGVASEEEAAINLCLRLGIESRSELNGNRKAQERFDVISKNYEEEYDPFG